MNLLERANELRARASDAMDEARTLAVEAEEEDRDLNEDELRTYHELVGEDPDEVGGEAGRLLQRADRLERQHRAQNDLPESRSEGAPAERGGTEVRVGEERETQEEFRSFGDFIHAVRFRPHDPRLAGRYAEREEPGRYETREQSMGTGAEGGFAVPEQFRDTLLEVEQQDAIIRPRAMVIPAGTPPDTAITMPALDQSSDQNMYGGVEVVWIGEGDTKPETDARLKEVRLEPHEVAAHIVVSDKLLRNWQAAGPTLERLLRQAIRAAEDDAFVNGNGVAKPQGIIGAGAENTVTRDTANEFNYADATAMVNSIIGVPLFWIINPGVRSELLEMTDPNGNYIWQPNAAEGINRPLLGIPILWNERSPTLGSKGDVVLAALNQYLIKDGSGPFVDASEHVHFKDNKTVIKAFWNVDGAPWLDSTIQDEGGRTVSPFNVLAA